MPNVKRKILYQIIVSSTSGLLHWIFRGEKRLFFSNKSPALLKSICWTLLDFLANIAYALCQASIHFLWSPTVKKKNHIQNNFKFGVKICAKSVSPLSNLSPNPSFISAHFWHINPFHKKFHTISSHCAVDSLMPFIASPPSS